MNIWSIFKLNHKMDQIKIKNQRIVNTVFKSQK
jgi:hypothetical protein